MRIELHPNDNGREGRPAVWGLQGKSVLLSTCGAGAFAGLFRFLAACDTDWPFDIGTGDSPPFAIAGYVQLLVNSKSPTFVTDILLFLIVGVKAWLSNRGRMGPASCPMGRDSQAKPSGGLLGCTFKSLTDIFWKITPVGRARWQQHLERDPRSEFTQSFFFWPSGVY
jgi:hypothetical protein